MYFNSKQLAKALIESVNENPKDEKKVLDNFLKFLKEKNITHQLPKVVRHLETELKRESALKEIWIRSKSKLSASTVNEIKKFIKANKDTKVNVEEDESLKGGFVATHNGIIYDASVAHQIEKLKQSIN